MTVQFQHIRECDEEGNLLNRGGCTIAYTASKELGFIAINIAICHPKDPFVKKIGRELAASRLATATDGPLDIVEWSDSTSEAVRLWFMQYFDVFLFRSSNGLWLTDWSTAEDTLEEETPEPFSFNEEDFVSDSEKNK